MPARIRPQPPARRRDRRRFGEAAATPIRGWPVSGRSGETCASLSRRRAAVSTAKLAVAHEVGTGPPERAPTWGAPPRWPSRPSGPPCRRWRRIAEPRPRRPPSAEADRPPPAEKPEPRPPPRVPHREGTEIQPSLVSFTLKRPRPARNLAFLTLKIASFSDDLAFISGTTPVLASHPAPSATKRSHPVCTMAILRPSRGSTQAASSPSVPTWERPSVAVGLGDLLSGAGIAAGARMSSLLPSSLPAFLRSRGAESERLVGR